MKKTIFVLIILFMFSISFVVSQECTNGRNAVGRIDEPNDNFWSADMDNDGDNDVLITSNSDNSLFIFYNNGLGSFTNFSTIDSNIGFPSVAVSGNFDGDDDLDVVALNTGANDEIIIYTNEGNQEFDSFIISFANPFDVRTGDMDNDGDIDIVVTSAEENLMRIYINDGTGIFTVGTDITKSGIANIHLADIDGDNDIDIVSCSQISDYVNWYENDGLANFNERVLSAGYADCNDVFAIDINGDGDIDILAVGGTQNVTTIYDNNGVEVFTEKNITTQGDDTVSVYSDDIDNDGDNDILVSNFNSDSVTIFINDGIGEFVIKNISSIEGQTKQIFLNDLNGDSISDIITLNTASSVGGTVFAGVIWFNSAKCQAIAPLTGTTGLDCGADHIMFCDDFDYTSPLFTKGWIPFIGFDFNNTYSPINNKLKFNGLPRFSVEHAVDAVNVDYRINEDRTVQVSTEHPVVSHEFKLNVSSNFTAITYIVSDNQFLPNVWLFFEGNTTYFFNNTINDFTAICEQCIKPNETHSIKITQYFGLDTINAFPDIKEFYPFNISENNSNYDVFIDGIEIATDLPITNVKSFNVRIINIAKLTNIFSSTGLELDDIFIYRGTAKGTDTSNTFFIDLFIPPTDVSILNETERSMDIFTLIKDNAKDMGVLTTGSMLLFALMIIAVTIIAIAVNLAKTGVSGGVIGVISLIVGLLELFFFVRLSWIPVWIIFILMLLGAGIAFLVLSRNN